MKDLSGRSSPKQSYLLCRGMAKYGQSVSRTWLGGRTNRFHLTIGTLEAVIAAPLPASVAFPGVLALSLHSKLLVCGCGSL